MGTVAKFLMFEQRVCCIKVVLPKKEMPALSVAIQCRKVPRNGATKRHMLAIEVVMDQHGSQYLLVIGGRIVGVTKEIMKSRRSPFFTLANCRTACGRRRRRRPAKGVAARTDQLDVLPASDERAGEDLEAASWSRSRLCRGSGGGKQSVP